MHTLERFRECFYRPLLSSTENFDRWQRKGARDTTARAGEIYRKTLDEFEAPAIDDAIREELAEFVSRRRSELGGLANSVPSSFRVGAASWGISELGAEFVSRRRTKLGD